MKPSSFLHFAAFGVKTILLRKKEPILGTVILTDSIRYLSSLTRDEAAKIIEASDGCITHPENDDIDWSMDEFINDWNALHRGEEAIAR